MLSWTELLPVVVGTCGGMLVGIDRERRKGSGSGRSLAGLRSFALAGALGAICQLLAQPMLVAIGALLVAALSILSYFRDRTGDPGTTTELALLLTYVLGVAAVPWTTFASAAFVVLALLLAGKERLHHLVTHALTQAELRDGLILAAAALVILPLVPTTPQPLLAGVNLHHLWRLLVVLLTIQWLGHGAARLLGARAGLLAAGLASGVVSSTATVAAMGAKARREPAMASACAAAAVVSNVSSMGLYIVVGMAIHPSGLHAVAAPLLAVLVLGLLGGGLLMRKEQTVELPTPVEEKIISIGPALGLVVALTVVTMLVSLASQSFGAVGAASAAILASLVEAQAPVATLLSLAAGGEMTTGALVIGFMGCVTANAAGKVVLAFAAGGRGFGARVGGVLGVGVMGMWVMGWLGWGEGG